jgi:hypothetical protein
MNVRQVIDYISNREPSSAELEAIETGSLSEKLPIWVQLQYPDGLTPHTVENLILEYGCEIPECDEAKPTKPVRLNLFVSKKKAHVDQFIDEKRAA